MGPFPRNPTHLSRKFQRADPECLVSRPSNIPGKFDKFVRTILSLFSTDRIRQTSNTDFEVGAAEYLCEFKGERRNAKTTLSD